MSGVFKGNVGIGTQKPSTPLEVNGAITADLWYDITAAENPVLSIGWPNSQVNVANQNLWIGVLAGDQGHAGALDTGTSNTFVGYEAAFHNISGSENTAIGSGAGYRNTTGNNNTAVGTDAAFGVLNQSVNNNTIVGHQAGLNNNGNNGSFYGYQAGSANTADGNSFFGFSAGKANTSGNSNTFLGNVAGTANKTGSGDTFVGDSAGAANVTSNDNTFMGQNAGKANTANNNSFYGYQAGLKNTSATQNTFVGYNAGSSTIQGGGNTFVGWEAGLNSAAPGNANCCNTYVGNGAGIGTPGSTGAGNSFFGHSAGSVISTGGKNVFSGYWSGLANTTGSFNAFYGDQSGQTNQIGNYNTFLGTSTGGSGGFTSGNNNIFVGAFAGNNEGNVNNNIEIGNPGPVPSPGNFALPTILIGVPSIQTKQTYIAGIWNTPIPNNSPMSVVVDSTGHLGTIPIPIGGGNVKGSCNNPPNGGIGFVPTWVAPGGLSQTLSCSEIFDTGTMVGIGTTTPSTTLDVNGDISAKLDQSSYQIAEQTVLTAFGDRNTIVGYTGAHSGNTGQQNTFTGNLAGTSNTGGSYNSIYGSAAGASNKNGELNVYIGHSTGRDSESNYNTFVGENAGTLHAVGDRNTFLGNGTGSQNHGSNETDDIYVGETSGDATSSLGNILGNIMVGNIGAASDNKTIRIGNTSTIGGSLPQQTDTYIAGISGSAHGTMAPAQEVCVDGAGKLWGQTPGSNCVISSRRFKDQITDMGDSSSKLFQLRPVTFFYKPQYDDGSHALQYGLIAEEVAKVYPEMVAYDKDGQPYTVKYQELAPMLLNELQKQNTVVTAQQDLIKTQQEQIETQGQQIGDLQQRLSRLEALIAKK